MQYTKEVFKSSSSIRPQYKKLILNVERCDQLDDYLDIIINNVADHAKSDAEKFAKDLRDQLRKQGRNYRKNL